MSVLEALDLRGCRCRARRTRMRTTTRRQSSSEAIASTGLSWCPICISRARKHVVKCQRRHSSHGMRDGNGSCDWIGDRGTGKSTSMKLEVTRVKFMRGGTLCCCRCRIESTRHADGGERSRTCQWRRRRTSAVPSLSRQRAVQTAANTLRSIWWQSRRIQRQSTRSCAAT